MKNGTSLIWHGQKALAHVKLEFGHQVKGATENLHADAVKRISKKFPPSSLPGEAPHARTLALLNSVKWAYDHKKEIGVVYSTVLYSKFLEFGTNKMQARPWLLTSVLSSVPNVKAMLAAKAYKGITSQGAESIVLSLRNSFPIEVK